MALSTGVASIGDMKSLPLPATAYRMSKVAVNYMVRKIHFENPELTVLSGVLGKYFLSFS
jgi:norsolorinic acid ketoreductase